MRRALWIVGAGDLGGVARHVLDVASTGIPGWRLGFLVPSGPLAARLSALGMELVDPSGSFAKDRGAARSIASVHRSLRSFRPHLVHSHLSWADMVTSLATAGTGVARVSTEHGISDVPNLYNPRPEIAELKRRLHHWRLNRTDGVISVSMATQRSITRQWGPLGRSCQAVVHNGVDPPPATPPRQGLRIGILSRIAPEKRVGLAIAAFAVLHARRPDARLVIGGTGDLELECRKLVSTEGLTSEVRFLGHAGLPGFWNLVDIVVQVSSWENCSYTLLDAISHGRGVVATRVGGNSELLPSACLVGANPAPGEIAQALAAQEGASHSLPPGWPTVSDMASSIGAFYESVVDARGVAPSPTKKFVSS